MSRRRRQPVGPLWELIGITAVAGAAWLVLTDVLQVNHTAAGLAAGAVGGLLVGFRLQPWADRAGRRFGIRVVRVGTPVPKKRATTSADEKKPEARQPKTGTKGARS